jgi:hypothetical protein
MVVNPLNTIPNAISSFNFYYTYPTTLSKDFRVSRQALAPVHIGYLTPRVVYPAQPTLLTRHLPKVRVSDVELVRQRQPFVRHRPHESMHIHTDLHTGCEHHERRVRLPPQLRDPVVGLAIRVYYALGFRFADVDPCTGLEEEF